MKPQLIEKIKKVIRVFETGQTSGGYGKVSIYKDGTHPVTGEDIEQVTYGAFQTTEQSHLSYLLRSYCANTDALYRSVLFNYIAQINTYKTAESTVLAKDATFHYLLKEAGDNDRIMYICQEAMFEVKYFSPAINFARQKGFKHPLSMLVIFDSFIHSGGLLPFLLTRFSEPLPSQGGREKVWIVQYLNVRRNWLATHKRLPLQKTVYRIDCFLELIKKNDWGLDGVVVANGKRI